MPVSEGGDASVHTEESGARLNRAYCMGVGRPGSVPFVSHRPGAYGRLLLSVYVWWKTGLLVSSDWLQSVARGGGGGLEGGVFRPRCANTTYRVSDYAAPSGEFGVPLHHPRFLEWIGVPESASLLKMGSGRWLGALSREKAMAAAIQLHRDVCLMTTGTT